MPQYMFDIKKEYNEFLRERMKKPMDFKMGNAVLYDMCKKYPYHNDTDEIISKIWLIGRSYAAAIERRKNAGDDGISDDFYYDKVAPTIKRYSKRLDRELDRIKSLEGDYKDNAESILSLHKYLMNAFKEITGLEKRSLASKYLHFHCPDKILIYDSRAQAAARKIVQRPNKPKEWSEKYDSGYVDFVCRVIDMTEIIKSETGKSPTPREVDNFLLHYVKRL